MMNDIQLFEQIQITQIFNNTIKNQLIVYFSKLTWDQKKIISSALESEKTILLDYLKSLKNHKDIPIMEIQRQACLITRQRNIRNESQEEGITHTELDNLILSLNTL